MADRFYFEGKAIDGPMKGTNLKSHAPLANVPLLMMEELMSMIDDAPETSSGEVFLTYWFVETDRNDLWANGTWTSEPITAR